MTARLRNSCCRLNATTHSVFFVPSLYVVVKNIKMFIVAVELQQWIATMDSLYTVFELQHISYCC
jgi:hypothetical protein